MSVTVSPEQLEGAERVLTTEDMYQKGLAASVPGAEAYNIVEAHKWFNLAAMKGCDQSRVYRKELLLEMTSAQVAEAQRIAREWLASRRAVMIG